VQVLHPALPGSPGHAHWQALCGDEAGRAAGLFSVLFDPRYSSAQVDAFCDALRLFKLGYSWGPHELVVPYDLATMRPSRRNWRAASGARRPGNGRFASRPGTGIRAALPLI
jgi:cystathionine beta-lyase